jgi:hypothetical protein
MDKMVVARLLDGRMYKGTTADFTPARGSFTLAVGEGPWKGEAVTLQLAALKAVFFVRNLSGNRNYREKKYQPPENPAGQKITVTFVDGETIRGTTMALNLFPSGFYLFPADTSSNNKRIFISRPAVKNLTVDR